jgi:alginate O-acetyltransferase complex protein AlgI
LCRGAGFLAVSPVVRAWRDLAFSNGHRRAVAPDWSQLMMNLIASLFVLHSAEEVFSMALWLSGIGHFCVLIASFQVPARLGWKEDLQNLTSFNRKLMWVHGGFAVLTIIAFGTLMLVLHAEMLRGDRAALGLALFIGVYWAVRIAVDFLYYDHKDWPLGLGFVLGHILLTSLFAFLAVTNLGLVIWKVWAR